MLDGGAQVGRRLLGQGQEVWTGTVPSWHTLATPSRRGARLRRFQNCLFGRASVPASPDFRRFPEKFRLAGTLAIPPQWQGREFGGSVWTNKAVGWASKRIIRL